MKTGGREGGLHAEHCRVRGTRIPPLRESGQRQRDFNVAHRGVYQGIDGHHQFLSVRHVFDGPPEAGALTGGKPLLGVHASAAAPRALGTANLMSSAPSEDVTLPKGRPSAYDALGASV